MGTQSTWGLTVWQLVRKVTYLLSLTNSLLTKHISKKRTEWPPLLKPLSLPPLRKSPRLLLRKPPKQRRPKKLRCHPMEKLKLLPTETLRPPPQKLKPTVKRKRLPMDPQKKLLLPMEPQRPKLKAQSGRLILRMLKKLVLRKLPS